MNSDFVHQLPDPNRPIITLQVSHEILLTEIGLHDAEIIFETIDRQRSYLSKWLPFVEGTKNLHDTRSFVLYSIATGSAMNEYVFRINFNAVFAGLIGFRNADKDKNRIELGYWLAEEFQHKGIISQSVHMLTSYAITKLGFKEVIIKCASENSPSRRIPENCGFEWIGQEEKAELLSDGNLTDIEIYRRGY